MSEKGGRRTKHFEEVGNSGVFVSWTRSNFEDSMDILEENGLEPLAYPEAMKKLDKHIGLKEVLKGNRFYLKDGVDPGLNRVDENGNIVFGKGGVERTVHVHNDKQFVMLYVNRDAEIEYKKKGRYELWIGGDPNRVAKVVIGVMHTDKALGKTSSMLRKDE